MKKTLFALAVALSAGATFAQSAPSKDAVLQLPAPVQIAVQGGLKVEKKFDAEGGLTGWILSQGPGKNIVVFTSADGQVAISGTMLNAKGENLTRQYLEQYGPKIDYDKAWPKLEKSAWFAEGAKGDAVKSVIYAFLDPNCSYCHLAWKALQPYMKAGLQVRWIPVAFLRPDSINKAGELLDAKDADAAMDAQQASFGKSGKAAPAPSAATRAKLEANGKLMAELGFGGTPALLYKDAAGKVKTLDGMPRLSQLPGVTGLPEQQVTDPELARFR